MHKEAEQRWFYKNNKKQKITDPWKNFIPEYFCQRFHAPSIDYLGKYHTILKYRRFKYFAQIIRKHT